MLTQDKTINHSHELLSIRLTKFLLLLAVPIIGLLLLLGPKIVTFLSTRQSPWLQGALRYWLLLLSGYVSAGIALIFVYYMYQLIKQIELGQLFIPLNVYYLQQVGRLVSSIALLALLIGFTCYTPILFLALACCFTTLIIRIVRHSFSQAVLMQDELDYTV